MRTHSMRILSARELRARARRAMWLERAASAFAFLVYLAAGVAVANYWLLRLAPDWIGR